MTTGLAFFVSVFFSPIFASIPSWATGGALVIVGTLMTRNVREINWDYIGDAVPAFLTLIIIPLTYKYALTLFDSSLRENKLTLAHSIAYGVIAGIVSYIFLNGATWLLIRATHGRLTPPNYHNSERWAVPPGGMIPVWMCDLIP
jgi:adenine/guanine/hypoxanthine permease